MKTRIFWIALLSGLFSISGCSKFLSTIPDDVLTEEIVFSTRNGANKFLANIYSYIPAEWNQRWPGGNNAGAWTGGSDEGKYLWDFVNSNSINLGTLNADSWTGDYWRNFYRGIRDAATFIAKVDQVTIDMTEEEKVRSKAEARALRAIYYFYLMRIYGPVILLGDKVIPVDAAASEINKPRNTVDECVAFIVSELEKAAADLPVRPINDTNWARLTKGAAKSFIPRTLLMAASPLYNGNPDYAELKNKDGKQLIPQTYDANKWKKAADSYKSFIDEFSGVYSLYRKNDAEGNYSAYISCRDVMLEAWNSEVIFGRNEDSNARNYETCPFHSGYGDEVRASGGLGATQGQVDAYFMANGRSIDDPASGYAAKGTTTAYPDPDDNIKREISNMWANREPRFYVGITYDNRRWLNLGAGVVITRLYWEGNSGHKISYDHCPTGYVVRKGAVPRNWRDGKGVVIQYRLANLYLDYIEALNESEPGHADILRYLNMIRQRAGIPGYGEKGLAVPSGKEAMREAIRKERRVELAFENVRFFDTRRWKIAEKTDNGPVYGLNNRENLPRFYEVVAFENRVFKKHHYFFPIPEKDVANNQLLVQNTGW